MSQTIIGPATADLGQDGNPDLVTPPKARIVYAVAGQGRGHAAKALAVAQVLEPWCEIIFFAGGEAFDFLRRKGVAAREIPSLRFSFKNSAIHLPGTIRLNAPLVFKWRSVIKKIRAELCLLEPNLVLSDFEPFVPRAAQKMGIQTIQMSHQVILLACRFTVPRGQRISFLKAYLASWFIIPDLRNAIGISFFQAEIRPRYQRRNVRIMPPVIREELLDSQANPNPRCNDHILVYLSCSSFAWLPSLLEKHSDSRFIVYGLEPELGLSSDRFTFKPISPISFLNDLTSARAVITNGGHNLIGEARYLGKPVLSFFVGGQFEQYLNASFVEKLEFGRMVDRIEDTPRVLREFFADLEGGHWAAPNQQPDPRPGLLQAILGRLDRPGSLLAETVLTESDQTMVETA